LPSIPLVLLGWPGTAVVLFVALAAHEPAILFVLAIGFLCLAVLIYSERRRKPPIYGSEWYILAMMEIVGMFAFSALGTAVAFAILAIFLFGVGGLAGIL
jgi:hypothetical protein